MRLWGRTASYFLWYMHWEYFRYAEKSSSIKAHKVVYRQITCTWIIIQRCKKKSAFVDNRVVTISWIAIRPNYFWSFLNRISQTETQLENCTSVKVHGEAIPSWVARITPRFYVQPVQQGFCFFKLKTLLVATIPYPESPSSRNTRVWKPNVNKELGFRYIWVSSTSG